MLELILRKVSFAGLHKWRVFRFQYFFLNWILVNTDTNVQGDRNKKFEVGSLTPQLLLVGGILGSKEQSTGGSQGGIINKLLNKQESKFWDYGTGELELMSLSLRFRKSGH